MARHQYVIKVIIDGPFDQDPSQTIETIKGALPGAEVVLKHKLVAASAGEIPDELVNDIQFAESGKVGFPASTNKRRVD